MDPDKPILINNFDNVRSAYDKSTSYLETDPDLHRKIARHIWAYHEISWIIPQTELNFGSGHFFPFTESYDDLEGSYLLALQGYYSFSMFALRSVLELGLLGIHFSVNDKEYEEVQSWLKSEEKSPQRKKVFESLRQLASFKEFDDKFSLVERIQKLFDTLDGFAHTRGFRHSNMALTGSNINTFSPSALSLYCDTMFSVVHVLFLVILLKYPLGIKPLPVGRKLGLNVPTHGFQEPGQVKLLKMLIPSDEWKLLEKISDSDQNVQGIVEYYEQSPDISEEEMLQQITEWESFMSKHSHPDDEEHK